MSNCIGLDISKRLIAVHIPINNSDIEINNNITSTTSTNFNKNGLVFAYKIK